MENISIVKFDGKNYPLWEFQFRMFVEGKDLLGVLNGTTCEPTEALEKIKWKTECSSHFLAA